VLSHLTLCPLWVLQAKNLLKRAAEVDYVDQSKEGTSMAVLASAGSSIETGLL